MAINEKKNSPRKGSDRALEHLPQLDREGLRGLAEKLCGERKTLETILESLREGVVVVDPWGTIEVINSAAERTLGIPRVEAGSPPPSLWRASPELAATLKVARDGSLTLGGTVTQEMEVHYPSARTLRLFASPLQNEDRLLIVLSDITAERSAAEENLEDARMGALTGLAAGVAHELGNPLNALQIHLQLMERALASEKLSEKGKKSIPHSLKIAQGEIRRLDQIIRNFLQALRPSTVDLRPADPVAILEEVLGVLHAELSGAKVKVSVELPGLLPPVMADSEQLKQVYFNLIKNAREALAEGGTLKIKAAANDEWLMLSFTDSGHGIAQEALTHLFEPYHTTKVGGSGLGLMIAQKIMRAHGGTIGVESKEGTGTTVTLSFPLQYKKFKTLEGTKG